MKILKILLKEDMLKLMKKKIKKMKNQKKWVDNVPNII